MYIDNENFDKWMEKLSKKLTEIGQDLKSLINTDQVLEENERLLDNQDLAFLLKVSFRTLQRYRLGYRKRSERDYKGWVEDKNKYFCIFVTVFIDLAEEDIRSSC